MTKAVIFDLWNTLATKKMSVSKTFFDHFDIPTPLRSLRQYEEAVQLVDWKTEEEMSTSLLESFHQTTTSENIAWVKDTFQVASDGAKLYPGMMELLLELKKKYKLALISNTTCFEAKALESLGLSKIFDVIVFSYEVGYLKPSEEIFKITLEKLRVLPQETIFIDDTEANVDAARKMGMRGDQFQITSDLEFNIKQLLL